MEGPHRYYLYGALPGSQLEGQHKYYLYGALPAYHGAVTPPDQPAYVTIHKNRCAIVEGVGCRTGRLGYHDMYRWKDMSCFAALPHQMPVSRSGFTCVYGFPTDDKTSLLWTPIRPRTEWNLLSAAM
ncbi:hypothetical protein Bbelb_132300 [Branchiostoma belcheri]|nr:hypothetical protein Bbelb_132300 [Branchiostoma belcheri]